MPLILSRQGGDYIPVPTYCPDAALHSRAPPPALYTTPDDTGSFAEDTPARGSIFYPALCVL